MEDDWEEEEQLVVAELSGVIDSDEFGKRGGVCKIMGISSEQPIVQVGRYVFAGEYEDAMGTSVIFEEQSNAHSKSSASPVLKYKCHTLKKLMLQRTFLSERKEGETSSGGIEVLTLNEEDVRGRAGTVCHYGLDTSEQSDSEKAPSSVTEDSVQRERGEKNSQSNTAPELSWRTDLTPVSDEHVMSN